MASHLHEYVLEKYIATPSEGFLLRMRLDIHDDIPFRMERRD